MASVSTIKGEHSNLIAQAALLANGFGVAKPVYEDTHDLVITTPAGELLRAQVKSIYLRLDKPSPYYVVYSRKHNGSPYTVEEAQIIIGVYHNEVYLIKNIENQEYWSKPEEADKKWELISPFGL
jgi:hypothetical protein